MGSLGSIRGRPVPYCWGSKQDGVISGELKYALKSKFGYPKGVVIWGMQGSGTSKEPIAGLVVDMIGIEC